MGLDLSIEITLGLKPTLELIAADRIGLAYLRAADIPFPSDDLVPSGVFIQARKVWRHCARADVRRKPWAPNPETSMSLLATRPGPP
ncbi:MAG: hypothetical protein GY842_06020 [bacterium]|nr:hypothetical protein [bacterium]